MAKAYVQNWVESLGALQPYTKIKTCWRQSWACPFPHLHWPQAAHVWGIGTTSHRNPTRSISCVTANPTLARSHLACTEVPHSCVSQKVAVALWVNQRTGNSAIEKKSYRKKPNPTPTGGLEQGLQRHWAVWCLSVCKPDCVSSPRESQLVCSSHRFCVAGYFFSPPLETSQLLALGV